MTNVLLKAPLSGYLMPIEEVPDPVFSQKMLGDGLAIDPLSNTLCAPCDGRIVKLHDNGHALTIATPQGVEVLLHVGLDTVQLGGEGFRSLAAMGDEVQCGQALIEFDPDYIARHAPSLLTLIVITNSERVVEFNKARGLAEAADTVIMDLLLNGADAAAWGPQQPPLAYSSETLIVSNEAGLHARPAAVLAAVARQFEADVRLHQGEASANAKSVVGIMNLNVAAGDEISLEATGPDAVEAIHTLSAAVANGLGADSAAPATARAAIAPPPISAPAPLPRAGSAAVILGATASPGIAVGNVFQFRRPEVVVSPLVGGDPHAERAALDAATAQAALELEALQASLHAAADPGKAAIFAVQEELLRDPDLLAMAQAGIEKGVGAAYAWQTAINTQAGRLEALDNELLAMRANDLRDAGRRVLFLLTGQETRTPDVPQNTILIAEDLAPSDVATLDRQHVAGLATTLGGPTSHAAILARSLDLPAIAGVEARVLELEDGTPLILDATRGKLRLEPSKEEIAYVVGMLRKRRQKRQQDLENAFDPASTTDGYRVHVMANISSQAEAEQALNMGAEGVGLLRTEFLFLQRRTPPGEEEQAETYAAIAGLLGGKKPLVIRTLDIGGDKPLAYLPMPRESNPFLGERGIRVGLDRPHLLRTQVRAILRASGAGGNVRIMFPMVSTLQEWRMARAVVEEEAQNLGAEPVPVGIMVEVPAAAIMAEQFAREADFFSIGTNDLAQYVLAMDRAHPKLAPQVDGLNPAVLRLIAQTTAGAQKHGRWVGVCGGLASDPQAVPLLLGLGVKELSTSAFTTPAIKALVRSLSLHEAHRKAKEALTLESAADVRALFPLEDYEL